MTLRLWALLLPILFTAGLFLQSPWLVLFSISITCVLLIARVWSRLALKDVVYHRKFRYRRGFPGETTPLQITVENNKWLPLSWLKTKDIFPLAVPPEDRQVLRASHIPEHGELTGVYSLKWQEHIQRKYDLVFKNRGVHEVGPVILDSGDFFGIFTSSKEVTNTQYLTVLPELIPLPDLKLSTDDPFGDRRSRRTLFEDPNLPMGTRPYQPGDPFRRIHWNATARTGDIQVKVYQPVSARVLVVCMNAATTSHAWLGTDSGLMEQLIRTSATLAYHGVQDGYSVGLFSNGCLSHADVPFNIFPGRSPGQLATLLQALASVTPYLTTSFESLLETSIPRLPYGSSLMVVTALTSPALASALLKVRKYRNHITLFSLANEPPPPIPGVRTIHLPFIRAAKNE